MSLKPKALAAGSTVGLVAPAGPAKDSQRVDQSVAFLESLGFKVKEGASCRASYGYLAGKDEFRASDLNDFFADREVEGIVCLKGGYGTSRILDALDYGAIARNPKALVGYSDITGLHLAIARMCSLATFHGPMPSSDMVPELDEFSRISWMKALTSATPLGRLENPGVGGNLSLVAALMGTPYEIDTKGRILFLEDVDEAPYRVDRMLTQLRLAGKFDDCVGVVLGDWKNCCPPEGKKSLTLMEVFQDIIAPTGKPAVYGFRAGHCSPTITFPLGIEAVLDADDLSIEMIEAAMSPP
jgi:muramoyltetrapeptide carboxypeptidase